MDGKSWKTAFDTIQKGLTASANPPNEIWITGGTYEDSINLSSANGKTFRGGFGGIETSADQVVPGKYPTIIDGVALSGSNKYYSVYDITVQNYSSGYGVTITGGTLCRVKVINCQSGITTPLLYQDELVVTNCEISGCTAAYAIMGPEVDVDHTTISNCTGTAICLVRKLDKCIIADNTVTGGNDKPHTLLSAYGTGDLEVVNCLITGTALKTGSAPWPYYGSCVLYTALSSPGTIHMMNCTIADTTEDSTFCRVVYDRSSKITVQNSILWNPLVTYETEDTPLITYSDTYSGYAGTGNINSDPLFTGDYHLIVGSPCIEAGSSSGAPEDDLDEIPRGDPPDQGAYEFVAEE
jgi:hypothetical protein